MSASMLRTGVFRPRNAVEVNCRYRHPAIKLDEATGKRHQRAGVRRTFGASKRPIRRKLVSTSWLIVGKVI